ETRYRMDERRKRQEDLERLKAPEGQVVYLHGRKEHEDTWARAFSALMGSGFTVLPADPDPVVNDVKRLQEIRNKRVNTMAECDAVLLVGDTDGRSVDQDLAVVGRGDRNSARAICSRLLPCALLDSAGVGTSRRLDTARGL